MRPLPMEAERLVEAARGWLGLGDWLAANEELEEIEAVWRAHPEVLEVRWRLYAAAGKLDEAVMIAAAAMKGLPERRAETLYELAVAACRLERVADARRWLGEALDLGGNAMKLRALEDRRLEAVWAAEGK